MECNLYPLNIFINLAGYLELFLLFTIQMHVKFGEQKICFSFAEKMNVFIVQIAFSYELWVWIHLQGQPQG